MHHSTYQTRLEDERWSKTCVSVFVFRLEVNIHCVLSTLWREVIVSHQPWTPLSLRTCYAAWTLWIQMLTMPSRPRVIWAMWLSGCWGISRRRRMVQDPGSSSLWRPRSWPLFSPCWWVPPLKCEECIRSHCFQQFSLIYLFSLYAMQRSSDLSEPEWFKEVTLPNSVKEFGVNREEEVFIHIQKMPG